MPCVNPHPPASHYPSPALLPSSGKGAERNRSGRLLADAPSGFTRTLESNQHQWKDSHIVGPLPPGRGSAIDEIGPCESHFRHSGWAADRLRVWAALQAADSSNARKFAFANCGRFAVVERSLSLDDCRVSSCCCHDRLCAPCATERAGRIARNVGRATAKISLTFLTLTLKVNSLPLKEQISRLYKSFIDLRRRKHWRAKVRGGAAFLEAKIGQNSGGWHVHLHVICVADYFAQADLSHEWYAVTGDSFIVDIRTADAGGKVISYVAKYGAKGCSSDVIRDPVRLLEYLTAVKGRRLCTTFGSWRGLKLEAHDPSADDWKPVCSLPHLIQAAQHREPWALLLIRALQRGNLPRLGDTS